MFEIVIFDDDKFQCESIKELVEKNCSKEVSVLTVSVPEELLQMAQNGKKIDILISDIYLEGNSINGIDVVKQILSINRLTQIIYITGYVEYCMDVYETDHVYFLRKPLDEVKLKNALDKAFDSLMELQNHVLTIQNAGNIVRVPVSEIFYIESMKRKVHIICQKQEYETYDKISRIHDIVGKRFVQCHRSFLVNMKYIKELQNDRIILTNDMEIMVSRNFYRKTKEDFLDYIGDI